MQLKIHDHTICSWGFSLDSGWSQAMTILCLLKHSKYVPGGHFSVLSEKRLVGADTSLVLPGGGDRGVPFRSTLLICTRMPTHSQTSLLLKGLWITVQTFGSYYRMRSPKPDWKALAFLNHCAQRQQMLPVCVLRWAFRWELFVYTLLHPSKSHRWMRRFLESGDSDLLWRLVLSILNGEIELKNRTEAKKMKQEHAVS